MDHPIRCLFWCLLPLLAVSLCACDILFAPGSRQQPEVSKGIRSDQLESFLFSRMPVDGSDGLLAANITEFRVEVYSDAVRFEFRLKEATAESPVQVGVNMDTNQDGQGDLWAFVTDLTSDAAVLTDNDLNTLQTLTVYPVETGIVEVVVPLEVLPENPTGMFAMAVSFHSGIESRQGPGGTLGPPVELVPTLERRSDVIITSFLGKGNNYRSMTTGLCPLTSDQDERQRYGAMSRQYGSFAVEVICGRPRGGPFLTAGYIAADTSSTEYWLGQSPFEGAGSYITMRDENGDEIPDRLIWGAQDRGSQDDDDDRWVDAVRYVYDRTINWHRAQHWHQQVREPTDEYIVSGDSTSHSGLHAALGDLEFWSDPAVE